MSRFFRRVKPFIRGIGNIGTPLCVSFGVASTVPTNNDAPSYVQDVFKKFGQTYEAGKNRKYIDIEEHIVESEQESIDDMPNEMSIEEFVEEHIVKSIEQDSDPKEPIKSTQIKESEYIPSNPTQYLSRFIDHTVLKPKSTESDIRKMCDEAIKYDFFSVCCNPCWVSLCKQLLKGTNVKICCVVGFPLGSNTTNIKVLEAAQAVKDGADEIDMVMNIGQAKSRNWNYVRDDIELVVNIVPEDVAIKVILETCLLSDDEIIEACKCATQAGAKFVKTSTGFGGGGATVEAVTLMRKTVDEESVKIGNEIGTVLVKASGGIRDSQKAKDMLRAGADRIGASSGIKIIGAGVQDTSTAKKKQEQY
eukprot:CAMPEP_0201571298 /NCGR_PEP_ID=MMETSP0190_2-20130828/13997_1 /ASSEMBLY_ACC=CAM_ASM_000263 /TAXON_ID=37353 /ORGANISM="Rosalina sp." /LENGTH=362 /DNA_ID=CAMNT_0047995777 /DNA_START=18 /DNA_END=1106 /DNA_ORIENTATION=-